MKRVFWCAATVFVLAGAPLFAVDLYDNGPLITNPEGGSGGADASAVQTAIGATIYGYGHQVLNNNRVADDFTITDAGGWNIEEILFYAYQTGSSQNSTITSVNVNVWDGRPGDGGVSLITTGTMVSTGWSGIYRTLDTDLLASNRPIMAQSVTLVDKNLDAGTYWLDWQTDGSLSSGPWAPPVTRIDTPGSGNARQSLAGVWGDLIDDGGPWQDDLPFIVRGTVVPEPATLMLLALGGLVAVGRRRS